MTLAEGGSQHACPVGVSKIRARSSVESVLNRPLAEILRSTEPTVVLAKEESRRRNAPRSIGTLAARRQHGASHGWRQEDALHARHHVRCFSVSHSLLRACPPPAYITYTYAYTSGRRALCDGLALALPASGSVVLRHMGHAIAGQSVGHLDAKGRARVRAGSELAVWLMAGPRRQP